MKPSRLFVYGTLRRGSPNQYAQLLQANSRFLNEARIQARLHQFPNYPGAVLSDRPDEWVTGELYELEHPEILKALDTYEGVEFKRVTVPAQTSDGRQLETWVYLLRAEP